MLRKHLIFVLLTLLVVGLLQTSPIPAQITIYWEDNFDDENLDGWIIETYFAPKTCNGGQNFFCSVVKGTPEIRIQDNALLIPNSWNSTYVAYNRAQHESTHMTGHWAFDIVTTSADFNTGIWFTFNDPTPETDFSGWNNTTPNGIEGYVVLFQTLTIQLGHLYANFTSAGPNASDIDELRLDRAFWPNGDQNGNFHIDITRQPNGNMTVWLEGSQILTAIDNTLTKSTHTQIDSFAGNTLYDNITVDDDYMWPNDSVLTTDTTDDEESPTNNGDSPIWTPIILVSMISLVIIRKYKH